MKVKNLLKFILFVSVFNLNSVISWAQYDSGHPLNHIFFKLDKKTYEAIKNDPFLSGKDASGPFADFVELENGDTQGNKWKALYIQGEHTYLELYIEGNTNIEADLGLVFSSDTLGGVANLDLRMVCKAPYVCKVQERRREDSPHVWFNEVQFSHSQNPKLATWLMEYGVEYMKEKRPSSAERVWSDEDVSPLRYNAAFFNPNGYLQDVEELHLTVTKNDYDHITMFANALAPLYTDGTMTSLIKTMCGKEQASFLVNGQTKISMTLGLQTKVNSLVLSLRKASSETKTLKLGNSIFTMEANKKTARWVFN